MSTVSNMSLFIPHVFKNISKLRISNTFSNLDFGKVDNIDLVLREGKNNDTFHSAYIYFEYWNDSEMTRSFQKRLRNPDKITKVVYDDPWYWIVLENKSSPYKIPYAPKKQLSKKIIDLEDLESCKKRLTFNDSFPLIDTKYAQQLEEQIHDVTLSLNYWIRKANSVEQEKVVLKEQLRQTENDCLTLENMNMHLKDDIECYKNKEWINMV